MSESKRVVSQRVSVVELSRRKSKRANDLLYDPDYYIDIKDVKLGPVLGKGAFSTVYVGRYFGDLVAVKKQTRDAETIEKYLEQELSILQNLKNKYHENIIGYMGASSEVTKSEHSYALYIITEFYQGGDLLSLLLDTSVNLGWKFRVNIANQAAKAVAYLHDNNMLHRDIKACNFLLDHNWVLKLADFGLSRVVADPLMPSQMTICGTNEYLAPEMLFQEEYSAAVDVFSLGFMFLELLCRQKVSENDFCVRRPQDNFQLDIDSLPSLPPAEAPTSMSTLVQQCLAYESAFRPTALEVCDWIEDLHSEMPDDNTPRPPMKPINFTFQEDSSEAPPSPRGALARELSQPISPTRTASMNQTEVDTKSNNSTSIFSGLLPRRISPNRHRLVSMDKGNIRMIELINKRNTHGFRLWKKLLISVQKTCLSWTNSAGQTKILKLRGASFNMTGPTRFHITYPGDIVVGKPEPTKLTKEFAVSVASKMVLWKQSIEDAIAAANQLAEQEIEKQEFLREANKQTAQAGGLRVFKDIDDWLTALGLSQYAQVFRDNQYNYSMICDMGLSDHDFQFLGIRNPLHQSVLTASSKPGYSEGVRVSVTDKRKFDSAVVYVVVSRYKFYRSTIYLRYTDFRNFDTKIRRLVKQQLPGLASPIPSLPGQGASLEESKDNKNHELRMQSFEVYLNAVSLLLHNTSPFRTLLEFLDLQSA